MDNFKKYISILLLGLFTCSVGFSLCIPIQIQLHKFQVQKSKHVQVVLMFTLQEFVNVKKLNSKEISIDGKMFDVKSITINQQNRIEVKGHFDIKEDKLLAKANKQHSQKEKTALQKMFQFMNGLFYESHSLFELDGQLYITSRYPFFESNTLVGFGKIDLPPPNC